MIRVGILTISDLGSRGEREDTAGRALKEKLGEMGWSVDRYEIVPDERGVISDRLREWVDDAGLQIILTTGGTGFADRDVTPEATLEVLDKQAPGIPEADEAVLPVIHGEVDEVVGIVAGGAGDPEEVDVLQDLALGDAEVLGELGDRHPVTLGQVAHHGEHAGHAVDGGLNGHRTPPPPPGIP